MSYNTILGASYFLMGKMVVDQMKSFEVKKVCRCDIDNNVKED